MAEAPEQREFTFQEMREKQKLAGLEADRWLIEYRTINWTARNARDHWDDRLTAHPEWETWKNRNQEEAEKIEKRIVARRVDEREKEEERKEREKMKEAWDKSIGRTKK